MMADNKKRKCENCTICGDQVIDLCESTAANKLDNSQVLERIRELNHGDVDESKISPFVACKTCRDMTNIAYEFVKKCRALMSVQSSPQLIIIVNQMSKEIHLQDLVQLFSEYGKIENLIFKGNRNTMDVEYTMGMEYFAHVTFSSEDETLRVMNAAQNKELCFDGKPLVVTRVSEDCSPIDILPDVCLSEIFLRLDKVNDKVQIGRVCKRWKEVLARSWNNIKNFSDDIDELSTVQEFESILKGCGNFLKSLKLSLFTDPASLVTLISEYCRNIEYLHLELNWDDDEEDYQDEILVTFTKCTKLRHLFIERVDNKFDYNNLQDLSEDMLEIHLSSKDIDTDPFIDLTKFQKLEALTLWNFTFDENTLNGIEHLVNLKYLSLDGSSVHPSNIRELWNLKKLKHLEIPDCGIDDGILTRIIQGNRDLEHLDISGNGSITDQSLQYVTHLSKLKILYMRDLPEVTATDFPEMSTLEELDVDGCSSIADWTLIMAIDKCPKLIRIHAIGVATWRLLINAEESIVLSIFPRFLEISTDDQLAERWFEFQKRTRNLRVFHGPRRSEMENCDWQGWKCRN